MFTTDWIHTARLSTVIDCGTHNGYEKVFITYQLVEYTIKAQDQTLPDYKQFAKYAYGSLVDLNGEEVFELVKVLGMREDDWSLLGYLIKNIGAIVEIDVAWSEYQGKVLPIVQAVVGKGTVPVGTEWWVDLKTFIITPETTKEEVNALGFDNKFVKKSAEYINVINKVSTQDLAEELF